MSEKRWVDELHENSVAGKKSRTQRTVDVLNEAYKRDPVAVLSLIRIMIPCNEKLADDPYIMVNEDKVLGGYTVGILGFVNGVLGALDIDLVVTKWSDEVDEEGRRKFLGFCVYEPPESAKGEVSHEPKGSGLL